MYTIICSNDKGGLEINAANRFGYDRQSKRFWFRVLGVDGVFYYTDVEQEIAQKAIGTILKKGGADLRVLGKYHVMRRNTSTKNASVANTTAPMQEESSGSSFLSRMAHGVSEGTKYVHDKAKQSSDKLKQLNEERAAQRQAEREAREAQREAERAERVAQEEERRRQMQEKLAAENAAREEAQRLEAERIEKEEARRARQVAILEREAENQKQAETVDDEIFAAVAEAADATIDDVNGSCPDDFEYPQENDEQLLDEEVEDSFAIREITKLDLDFDIEDISGADDNT